MNSEQPDNIEENSKETGVPQAAGRRVLIVDDSDSIRRTVRETLEGMPGILSIDEARDGIEGLAMLSKKGCDLIVTDLTMPRLDGFRLVAAVRQNPQLRDAMIIVLSSRGESVDKIKGLTAGANDYMTKPFERGELQARVTVMFKMKDLQDELQRKNAAMEQANAQLAMLANLDGLTGIPNRRYFFERFEIEFRRARRLKSPLGLLMMDIDRFKAFNDTWGHLAGDDALKAIAAIVSGGIRTYDLAGRYGGEELIAFLPATSCDEALVVAERLRRDVAAHVIEPLSGDSGQSLSLTLSVGIACWPDVGAEEPGELVRAADGALYLAKAEGRNRCVVAAGGPGGPAAG